METRARWLCLPVIVLAFGMFNTAYSQSRTLKTDSNASEATEFVAIVNGQLRITRKEIDDLVGSQIYSLEERLYHVRKSAVENLLTKILLEEEAKARHITVEQLKQQLIPERVEIKQSRIDQVYAESAGGLGDMSEEEAKQRIRIDLEGNEKVEGYKRALAELRRKASVEVLLVGPSPPVVRISDSGPSRGGRDASVLIVEFSDFQCPYCKQATSTLKQVLQSYGESVRLVFKHTPLPIHADAFKAAQAAVCADKQGKFWEYHDRLSSLNALSTDALRKEAAELGLEMTEFNSCLDSEASRAAVLKDMKEARQADVQGTPTFVINGKVIRGAKGLVEFKQIIDEALKKTQPLSSTGGTARSL
ncbi:MAG TPA: thioredoxin domain-containing protein [Blastocatellia bacterium]|nr:thioredoxin domain-containing protein [Blastocatellia bacterium]